VQARAEMGFGPKPTMAGRLGQIGGALGNDALFDKTRSIYWLLNAAQAAGAVINEGVLAKANPDLYGSEDLGMKYDLSRMAAGPEPLAHKEANGRLAPNQRIFKGENGNVFRKNYRSGAVQALGVPAGFAINQGLGLMTPFGGYEGYEAVIPDADDPTKTANVVGEIASKYIMGRTGNLLNWDEFQKVRPDVSKDEYMRYKAFKFDKEGDLNPFDDGQITIPTGVIKATADGIHGAEVQFLGRSLPVNTAIVPFASAVAGAALGARKRRTFKPGGAEFMKGNTVDQEAVKRGLIGGTAGVAGGMAVGNLLEGERRRRNELEQKQYTG
jgi:hypothetical protein